MNNHYNGTFLEPWGERSQRGYGIEAIERFVRELAWLEHSEEGTRGERLATLASLAYNDLAADRQTVGAFLHPGPAARVCRHFGRPQ